MYMAFYPTRPSIFVLICVLYYSYSGKYISWFVLFIITEFGFIYWFFIIQILGEYNYSYTAPTEDLDILSSIFKKKINFFSAEIRTHVPLHGKLVSYL